MQNLNLNFINSQQFLKKREEEGESDKDREMITTKQFVDKPNY